MRYPVTSIPVAMAVGWVVGISSLHAQNVRRSIPSGHWQLIETFENEKGKQTVGWAFELVDDGSATLIAVGRRYQTNGEPVKDRTAAILFIDIHDDGTLGGSLIEAYGDGEQIELSLDIDLSPNGNEISMAAFDSEGSIVSKFKGQWLGKGLQANLKSGTWEVREIVSPGKGRWDIEWKYQFKESKGKISGKGNKAVVNSRKAYRGESRTWCSMSLERLQENKNAITGKGVETNYKGRKSRSSYEGWLSPSGRTFFMMSYESDGLAALIIGRYSG